MMNPLRLLSLFLFTSLTHATLGQKKQVFLTSPRDTSIKILADDPILSALDSLANLKLFQASRYLGDFARNNPNLPVSDSINPYFDVSVYEDRINKLDATSPFKYVYNDAVRAYIDMYAGRKRNQVSRMIGLSHLYFPMFEEMLAKHKMPLELKYLAIVESALNPSARSRAGAQGLWQFMYSTGRLFNLNVTSYIDERCDPIKSTEAACLYMKYLYSLYKDWALVLAAYNSGPGNVNKAIRRSGGKMDYWALRPFLPQETAGYVPAFIAASYVFHYSKEHKLYPLMPKATFFEIDTVHIKRKLTFAQISTVLDIPDEDLRFLNPAYLLGEIPETGQTHVLTLPKEKVATFVNNEQTLFAYKPPAAILDSLKMLKSAVNVEQKIHVVKAGESLSLIARKYRVSVNDLKRWNSIKTNAVKPGTRLVVNSPYRTPAVKPKSEENKAINSAESTQTQVSESNTSETSKEKTDYATYKVKPGDTAWKIAVNHGMTVNELKELNNLKSTQVNVGQVLKVKPLR